jgi:hypothetical protein
MSRLDELKKQYPELNVTLFDMMTRIDTSKSYKYLPLLCKIFGRRFNPKKLWHKDDYTNSLLDLQTNLINRGISTDELTDSQMYYIANYFAEHFSNDTYQTIKEFMEYMEKGLIENKDVTSYKDIEDVRGAVTLATMNENIKELEGQVIKEFEDEKWVAVRPLTFSASSKYGSSTRWCTTYQREKNYFEKYWRKGILVYFINKQTGYKFAGYKGLDGDSEFSFWNAEDSRIDYLDVNADDYLFPIVRRIFKSEMTNKNLSSDEIQEQVHSECILSYEKMRIQFRVDEMDGPVEIQQPTEESQEMDINEMRERLVEATRETHNNVRELRAEVSYSEDVPTMSA